MWLGGITSNHVNLHVPKGTKDIYEQYKYWRNRY